jgi:hypothetical protein
MADQTSRIRVILEAVLTNFTSGMSKAVKSIDNLSKESDKAGKAGKRAMEDINSSTRKARNSLEGLRTLLGTLFSMYAGKKLLEFTVGEAADYETSLLRYKILLKDTTDQLTVAKARMAELQKFAIFTPYVMKDVVDADLLLQNFGIRSIELLRVAGDAAAGSKQPIQEIAFWLGRIASGDTGYGIMRLAEMGIVTKKQLQDLGLQFSKSGEYVGSLDTLMNTLVAHMEGRYKGAMDDLSRSGSGLFSTVQDFLLQFGRDVGFKALDSAKASMITFINMMQKLRDNGTLDKWATQVGGAIAWVFDALTKFAGKIDEIGGKLSAFFSWFGENWSWLSQWIMYGVECWLIFKAAMAIEPLLKGIGLAIGIIAGAMDVYAVSGSFATAVTWAFQVALDALGIGVVIALIGMLILAIIKLVKNWDTAKNWLLFGANMILLGMKGLAYGCIWYYTKIVEGLAWVTSWIPGLGTAMEGAAAQMNNALQSVRNSMDDTIAKMNEYKKAAQSGKGPMDEKEKDSKTPTPPKPVNLTPPGMGKVPTFTGLGNKGGGSGSRTKKQDVAIDIIEEYYNTKLKISEGKAKLHEDDKNRTLWKTLMGNTITLLKGELAKVEKVFKTSTGDLKEKAEAKKYDILNKIKDITKEIKENTAKMVDDFGTPSFLNSTSLKQFRSGSMRTSGFTVSGANFIFELKEAPRTVDDWKQVFSMSQDALSNGLDNRRRRK